MKPRHFFLLIAAVALVHRGLAVSEAHRTRAASDLGPPESRPPVLAMAARLAQPTTPEPLPADIVQPFNPTSFNQPDGEEGHGNAAQQTAAANAAPSKPSGDHDILAVIAPRILPTGTLILGGEPLLIFGKMRLKVGDHLTVSYDGADYSLELTHIDRTNFTLRLNTEEIIRPIKPGKTP